MNKTITKTKKPAKRTANAKKQIINKPTIMIFGAFIAGVAIAVVCTVTVINNTYATSQFGNNVPITSAAEADVSNVTVEVSSGNSIRVQFDYALANGATSATVDAALNDQLSFGATTVTGSGHYDQTVTNIADGKYYIALVISGNPDYVLGDPGPSNQPLVITLPDTTFGSNGGHNIYHIERYFHKQKQSF